MIRVRETDQLITEQQFREMHPNTSFPQVITEVILNEFNCDVVFERPPPEITLFQSYVQDGFEEINGKLYIKYSVIDKSQDTIDAMIVQQWASIRAQRNKMLDDTDWIVLRALESGTSVDPLWITYRQALRDVTNQTDPFNIVWPEQPV